MVQAGYKANALQHLGRHTGGEEPGTVPGPWKEGRSSFRWASKLSTFIPHPCISMSNWDSSTATWKVMIRNEEETTSENNFFKNQLPFQSYNCEQLHILCLQDFLSYSFCSDGGLTRLKRQLNKSSRCLTHPHQLSVDTIHCFTRYADADQH